MQKHKCNANKMSGFDMIAGGGDNCAHETIVQTRT